MTNTTPKDSDRSEASHDKSSSVDAASQPKEDPLKEAERLIGLAAAAGIPLRVIGGVAIALRCPSARTEPLARPYRDIDFAARSADGPRITALFTAAGYRADAEFNALHGRHRMFFWDPRNNREADVFLDTFTMCHTLEFRERLELNPRTLPVADLLLFKLQVMETNDKDYKDTIALLADHPLTPDGLDATWIAQFLSTDWGWWRTVTLVLERVETYLTGLPQLTRSDQVRQNIRGLLDTINSQPKTGRWKLRARVGERKRWYETPEDAH